jgi:hypothetical protein
LKKARLKYTRIHAFRVDSTEVGGQSKVNGVLERVLAYKFDEAINKTPPEKFQKKKRLLELEVLK